MRYFSIELIDTLIDSNFGLLYDEYLMVFCLQNGCDLGNNDQSDLSLVRSLLELAQSPAGVIFGSVNSQCLKDINGYGDYPFAFWDSWGKLVLSGYLEGNLKSWGRSDECFKTTLRLDNQTREVATDYCLSRIPLGIPLVPLPLEQEKFIRNT